MELHDYLTVLRKSWAFILIVILLGGAAGGGLYLATPKAYATTVDFYVSTPTKQNDNPQASGQFAESRVNSYILLLSSEQLAQRVVNASGVGLTPLEVASRITASAEINTVVIRATVTDSSAQRSLQIAQGVTQSFGPLVDDLDNVGRTTPVVLIHTVSGPTLKSGPVTPDLKLYLGAGLLAGLVLSVVVALLAAVLRRQRRNERSTAGELPDAADPSWGWDAQDEQAQSTTPAAAPAKG